MPVLLALASWAVPLRRTVLLGDLSRAERAGVQPVPRAGGRMVTAVAEKSDRRQGGIKFSELVDRWGRLRPNPWGAFSQDAVERLATTTSWTLAPRLFCLAFGRMDRHGHSMWAQDELRESLDRLDPTTGELIAVDRTSVAKALRSLIDEGWVCEDSTVRCVRFSQNLAQKAVGKSLPCRVHR